jgi:hypothetical protein
MIRHDFLGFTNLHVLWEFCFRLSLGHWKLIFRSESGPKIWQSALYSFISLEAILNFDETTDTFTFFDDVHGGFCTVDKHVS